MSISPAEAWIIEPDTVCDGFSRALSWALYAGVDFAFGPGDTLPRVMPERLDGIKAVFVVEEDFPRIQGQLTGFRGVSTTGPDPFLSPVPEPIAQHIRIALHENDRTWLVVMKNEALLKMPQWLEYCLLVAPGLTTPSPAGRERLLARDDRELYGPAIERVLTCKQMRRFDVATGRYYLAKILLEAAQITGEKKFVEAFKEHTARMLERAQGSDPDFLPVGMVNFMWMHQLTGEDAYRQPVFASADLPRQEILFKPGSAGWCHAHQTMTEETRQAVGRREGMMGTYGEQMGIPLAMMRVARFLDRENEYADIVARFVKSMHKNLRDPASGLYVHGIAAHGLPGTMGHGIGWSAVGLAQILDDFPRAHPEYEELVAIFRAICEAAVNVQGPYGGFHSILNWHTTPVNEHYTSWLTYALLHGVRKGYLDRKFLDAGMAGWHCLKSRMFRGAFAMACGATGVSNRMEFYLQRTSTLRPDALDSGLGFVQQLLAFHEILFLNDSNLDDSLPAGMSA